MAVYNIHSGESKTGISLHYHDSMFVSTGGTAANIAVKTGAFMQVLSGGTASAATRSEERRVGKEC